MATRIVSAEARAAVVALIRSIRDNRNERAGQALLNALKDEMEAAVGEHCVPMIGSGRGTTDRHVAYAVERGLGVTTVTLAHEWTPAASGQGGTPPCRAEWTIDLRTGELSNVHEWPPARVKP